MTCTYTRYSVEVGNQLTDRVHESVKVYEFCWLGMAGKTTGVGKVAGGACIHTNNRAEHASEASTNDFFLKILITLPTSPFFNTSNESLFCGVGRTEEANADASGRAARGPETSNFPLNSTRIFETAL